MTADKDKRSKQDVEKSDRHKHTQDGERIERKNGTFVPGRKDEGRETESGGPRKK